LATCGHGLRRSSTNLRTCIPMLAADYRLRVVRATWLRDLLLDGCFDRSRVKTPTATGLSAGDRVTASPRLNGRAMKAPRQSSTPTTTGVTSGQQPCDLALCGPRRETALLTAFDVSVRPFVPTRNLRSASERIFATVATVLEAGKFICNHLRQSFPILKRPRK